MWTPAVAVIWESWRLTRRRLLLVPALVTLCTALLAKSTSGPLAFIVLFTISIATAISMPLFGVGTGFPFSNAFARPIRTATLVAAPLSHVFAGAAVSYLVPAVVVRLFMGVPFPLISVAIVIGALAVLVAGCNWVTRSAMLRMVLVLGAFIAAGAVFKFLDPFRNAGNFFGSKSLSPDLFVLSGTDYVALLFFVIVLYVWIALAVEWQRHGDEELSFPRAATTDTSAPSRSGDILTWVRNTCVELFHWRCPISSPTAAEVWFELQYYGIAVLVIGALLALCIPLLVHWGKATHSGIPIVLAACTFAGPFLAGVSASIWNRRNSWRAEVSAFEAARPIGTGELIGLQVLIASVCICGAWMLMALSFSLSFDSAIFPQSGLRLLIDLVVSFVLLTTLLAFLAALRALVSSFGWRVWIGAVLLTLYAIGVMVGVSRDWVSEAVIGLHIRALIVAIPVGTVLVLSKAVAGGAVSPRQVGRAALIWVVYAALFADVLRAGGVADAPPPLVALAFASALLPLAAVGLAPWSVSRIRHA
jgi:hypothetical protein